MTKSANEGQVKIRVPLLGSARQSGFEFESLWAEPLGGNRYRIWNLPVFAYNLDMRAVVECREEPGDLPIVTKILEPGDCYVIRLFFAESATDAEIQDVLVLLGSRRALFEKYDKRLWAVGLRTVEDFEWVGPALQPFVDANVLTFESGLQAGEPTIGESA